MATVAICHVHARNTLKPGGVLFSVSCKRQSAFGVDCTERLLLQVLVVDQTLSLSQYYGPRAAPWTHDRQAEKGQLQETMNADEDAIKTIKRWRRVNKSNWTVTRVTSSSWARALVTTHVVKSQIKLGWAIGRDACSEDRRGCSSHAKCLYYDVLCFCVGSILK